jgi:hypothetical protein
MHEGVQMIGRVPWVFAAMLTCGVLASGVEDHQALASLRGLTGVRVLVEQLRPEVEQQGLAVGVIQNDVELRLRKAGIQVLSESEMMRTAGMPYLYVNVNIKAGQPNWGFSVDVELKQTVRLSRPPNVQLVGISTWSTGRAGGYGPSSMVPRAVRDDLADLVDQFANDFLRMNPK